MSKDVSAENALPPPPSIGFRCVDNFQEPPSITSADFPSAEVIPYPQSDFNVLSLGPNPIELVSYKSQSTVIPINPFHPQNDAEILYEAVSEKQIVDILAQRTSGQRLAIDDEFKILFQESLTIKLKARLHGNLGELVQQLLAPLPQLYALELSNDSNHDVFIETMFTLNNTNVFLIKKEFEEKYNKKVEDSIGGNLNDNLKDLLISLCKIERNEETNIAESQDDALTLIRNGHLNINETSFFKTLLCRKSVPQLRSTFEEYHRLTGHDIEWTIKKQFFGSYEEILVAITRAVRNPAAFFARKLNKSTKGLFGVNHRDLIRMIVIRCEIDMKSIKNEYQLNYGESLCDVITTSCTGNYKKCLLTLIGEH